MRTARVLLPALLILSSLLTSGRANEIPSHLKALHVLNRLAFGPGPGDIERVKAMGADAYIEAQLSPDTIPVPDGLQRRLDALSSRMAPPVR